MLINGNAFLKTADKYHYAQGAFNVNTEEQVDAAIQIHEALRAPLFLQGAQLGNAFIGGKADFKNGNLDDIKKGADLLADYVAKKAEVASIPIALHLDHGLTFDVAKACIDSGYTSVMIDGSAHEYEDNVELTKKVVDYAHKYGVTVEGELGTIAGVEDHVFAKNSSYTSPLQALDFINKTGVDSLAISYGTKHGANKGSDIKLRMQIVTAIKEILLSEGIDVNLVSHGSSTIPQYIVEEINNLGGNVNGTGGIPIEQLKVAIGCGINKINIDSDIRLATTRNFRELGKKNPEIVTDPSTAGIYKLLAENEADIDPRTFLAPVMDLVTENKADTPALKEINRAVNLGTQEIMGQLIVNFGMLGMAPKVMEFK